MRFEKMNVSQEYEIVDLKDEFVDCDKRIVELEEEFENQDMIDIIFLNLIDINVKGDFEVF